jgi:hypothetical protein
MPSYINGIDTTLITGLGQIGVGGGSAPIVYPSGGLVVSSGVYKPSLVLINGLTPPTGSSYFYSRIQRMDSASLGTSTRAAPQQSAVIISAKEASNEKD